MRPSAGLLLFAVIASNNVDAFSVTSSKLGVNRPVALLQQSQLDTLEEATNNGTNERAKKFAKLLLERSDTLRAAGLYDDILSEDGNHVGQNGDGVSNYPPLMMGAKTNMTLFAMALLYKWYRSIFINKLAIWERQPQWNTVITSKEEEEKANLEAMTCNECGSTVFIAKGRKWFQMPKDYKCYCCGNKGIENFTNTREELVESIDDDYFDYEKPLDFITRAERRQLLKQAGGDEQKAMDMLIQGSSNTAESVDSSVSVGEESTADAADTPKKKKSKKKKKKKKKAVETVNEPETEAETEADTKVAEIPVDELDILDMD